MKVEQRSSRFSPIFSDIAPFGGSRAQTQNAYSRSRISLRNAGQFHNARNGVGHQVNLVEDIIPDVLLCAIIFENCYKPPAYRACSTMGVFAGSASAPQQYTLICSASG